MKKLLVHFAVLGAAIAVAANFVPDVHVRSLEALAIGAIALGLVNAFVRPVLTFFSFPLTLLTVGLFYLLVNGACFALAAYLVRGFEVSSAKGAVLGALCTSVVSFLLEWLLTDDDDGKRKKKRNRKDD